MAPAQNIKHRRKAQAQKAAFTLSAKKALIEQELTITELAQNLSTSRNTVSMAINHCIGRPTVRRVASFLNLKSPA